MQWLIDNWTGIVIGAFGALAAFTLGPDSGVGMALQSIANEMKRANDRKDRRDREQAAYAYRERDAKERAEAERRHRLLQARFGPRDGGAA